MIHSNAKIIMENREMKYAVLESLTGLSSQTITRSRGPKIREMSLETLETIAHALGVGIKDLFNEGGVPHDVNQDEGFLLRPDS